MITKERLHELFIYDSGKLIRKISVKGSWKGTEIGTTKPNGYKVAVVDTKMYRIHHLIWVYHHGYKVPLIDHINRNPSDNRIENLRPCTRGQNQGNSTARKGKYKGVTFCKQTQRWRAQISIKHKGIHLGRYDNPEDAASAYNTAAKEYFGEFAYLNEI